MSSTRAGGVQSGVLRCDACDGGGAGEIGNYKQGHAERILKVQP